MMILKKGTQVKVISGKDKGKTGEILEIDRIIYCYWVGFSCLLPKSNIIVALKEKLILSSLSLELKG